MIDKDELLKLVTEDVVINIMEENGSPLYSTSIDGRTQQKCLWFKTICHGGDSHKLCFFTESKDFFCYTKHYKIHNKIDYEKFIKINYFPFYHLLTGHIIGLYTCIICQIW